MSDIHKRFKICWSIEVNIIQFLYLKTEIIGKIITHIATKYIYSGEQEKNTKTFAFKFRGCSVRRCPLFNHTSEFAGHVVCFTPNERKKSYVFIARHRSKNEQLPFA